MTVSQVIAVSLNDFTAERALEIVKERMDFFPHYAIWSKSVDVPAHARGRFSGLPGATANGRILPVTGNETSAASVLTEILAEQDRNFLRLRDYLIGATVAVSDHDDYVFGLPTDSTPAAAARRTALNKEMSHVWGNILRSGTRTEATAAVNRSVNASVDLPGIVECLMALTMGKWTEDSLFFNLIDFTSEPEDFLDRMPGIEFLGDGATLGPDWRVALVDVEFTLQ